MDRRINLILAIYFAQVAEKTGGQIAIAHPPFLHIPSLIFWLLVFSVGIKIIRECMGQTVVQTHIGLKMVVDERPLDSVKNGIDMGLPDIRWFEIPKRS